MQPRFAYICKGGREERQDASSPREFLYGLPELRDAGVNVELCSDRTLGLDKLSESRFGRIFNALGYWIFGIPVWACWQLFRERRQLEKFDALFVTTNTFGLCLGLLKKFRLIRAEIVFLAMGLLEKSTPVRWYFFYRWALQDVVVLAIAQADGEFLTKGLGRSISHIDFGVDPDFWVPATRKVSKPYCFSIGNDRHRDYDTLIAAWESHFPELIIVTKLAITSEAPNIKVVSGDWATQVLSDNEVRTFMQEAHLVIIPIRNVIQPSGQSAALQAMACGRPVMVTDYPGLWNREAMVNGRTCLLMGRPGSVEDVKAAVTSALSNPDELEDIGRRARVLIESRLNCSQMARQIQHHLVAAVK